MKARSPGEVALRGMAFERRAHDPRRAAARLGPARRARRRRSPLFGTAPSATRLPRLEHLLRGTTMAEQGHGRSSGAAAAARPRAVAVGPRGCTVSARPATAAGWRGRTSPAAARSPIRSSVTVGGRASPAPSLSDPVVRDCRGRTSPAPSLPDPVVRDRRGRISPAPAPPDPVVRDRRGLPCPLAVSDPGPGVTARGGRGRDGLRRRAVPAPEPTLDGLRARYGGAPSLSLFRHPAGC